MVTPGRYVLILIRVTGGLLVLLLVLVLLSLPTAPTIEKIAKRNGWQFERWEPGLLEAGFRETSWDGWTGRDREVMDRIAPMLVTDINQHRVMWRITEEEDGYSAAALSFDGIGYHTPRYYLIWFDHGVFHATLSETLDVTWFGFAPIPPEWMPPSR